MHAVEGLFLQSALPALITLTPVPTDTFRGPKQPELRSQNRTSRTQDSAERRDVTDVTNDRSFGAPRPSVLRREQTGRSSRDAGAKLPRPRGAREAKQKRFGDIHLIHLHPCSGTGRGGAIQQNTENPDEKMDLHIVIATSSHPHRLTRGCRRFRPHRGV